jgi:hypothetical protein
VVAAVRFCSTLFCHPIALSCCLCYIATVPIFSKNHIYFVFRIHTFNLNILFEYYFDIFILVPELLLCYIYYRNCINEIRNKLLNIRIHTTLK